MEPIKSGIANLEEAALNFDMESADAINQFILKVKATEDQLSSSNFSRWDDRISGISSDKTTSFQ